MPYPGASYRDGASYCDAPDGPMSSPGASYRDGASYRVVSKVGACWANAPKLAASSGGAGSEAGGVRVTGSPAASVGAVAGRSNP